MVRLFFNQFYKVLRTICIRGTEPDINSFSVTTFEKNCNFGGEHDGAMNMALQPDVKHKIVKSLEVLSSPDMCLFHAKNACPT